MSDSSGKILGLNRGEQIGTLTAAGASVLAPEAVMSAIHFTAGGVNAAMNFGVEAASTAGNSIGAGAIGSLAPFALPAIAGGYAGKTIADIAKVENKTIRRVLTWGGAALGAGAATTALAPYLVGGAIAHKIGAKPFKWAAGKVGQTASAVVAGAVGTPISAVKSIPGNIKKGWSWGKNS